MIMKKHKKLLYMLFMAAFAVMSSGCEDFLEAENKGINDEITTIKMLITALKGNTHQLGLKIKFSPKVLTLKATMPIEIKMLTGVLIRHKIKVSLP